MTILDKAKEVLEIINDSRGEARFVGGCVRDAVMNKIKPQTDIDIATNMKPDKVTSTFEKLGHVVIPTGIRFGTVTVLYDGKPYEITTLRKDLKCYGRHAEVAYSDSFEEDSTRRDFTFNALYMDVDDKIYDFHNGMDDLRNGVVRFIGNPEDRIKEDYLRILRLFRFHTRFGRGEIIDAQLKACEENLEGLDTLSGERIHDEMRKILANPASVPALKEMFRCKVLQKITHLTDEFFNFSNLESYYKFSSKDYNNHDDEHNWVTALNSLLDTDSVKNHLIKIKNILSRLKFSNLDKALFYNLWQSLDINYEDDYEFRKLLRAADKDEFKQYIYFNLVNKRIPDEKGVEYLKLAESFNPPQFPLNGMDVMNQAKMQPGKKLGELLRKLEELWERGNYKLGRNDLLDLIRLN